MNNKNETYLKSYVAMAIYRLEYKYGLKEDGALEIIRENIENGNTDLMNIKTKKSLKRQMMEALWLEKYSKHLSSKSELEEFKKWYNDNDCFATHEYEFYMKYKLFSQEKHRKEKIPIIAKKVENWSLHTTDPITIAEHMYDSNWVKID